MKTLACSILSAASLVLPVSAETLQIGGTWFFSVPTKDVEEVRAMAKEPGKGTDVFLVGRTLREKPGVEIVSNWWKWEQWDDRLVVLNRFRNIRRNGESVSNDRADAELSYRSKAENGVGLVSLGLNCKADLKPNGAEYVLCTGDSGLLPVLEGQWREMAAWEQGDRTWLMWQRFPELETRVIPGSGKVVRDIPLPSGASEEMLERREAHFQADAELSFTVELIFFKTTPVVVGQLAKAGPENREKAAQWLISRSPAWRKLRICQRVGEEKRRWSMSHEKRGAAKGGELVYKSALNLAVTGKRTDDVLSMNFVLNHMEGDPVSQWSTGIASLEKVTPGWNFVLLENCGDLNAVAYREIKAE